MGIPSPPYPFFFRVPSDFWPQNQQLQHIFGKNMETVKNEGWQSGQSGMIDNIFVSKCGRPRLGPLAVEMRMLKKN
jgi:hypothetical protein